VQEVIPISEDLQAEYILSANPWQMVMVVLKKPDPTEKKFPELGEQRAQVKRLSLSVHPPETLHLVETADPETETVLDELS